MRPEYRSDDLHVVADLGQLFPGFKLTKGSRFTMSFENITNSRQRVSNSLGIVPVSYQPAYRDPIGRTAMFELRKVF